MAKKSQTVLGIDPGYGITGYGVIKVYEDHKLEAVTYGVIRTPSSDEFITRLQTLSEDLRQIIKTHQPDLAGVEKLFFAKNTKTAIDVGQARGVILLSLIDASVPVLEFTPLQIKQAITTYGQAKKDQMQRMVKTILQLDRLPKPDDAADALAVAITAAQSQAFLAKTS